MAMESVSDIEPGSAAHRHRVQLLVVSHGRRGADAMGAGSYFQEPVGYNQVGYQCYMDTVMCFI